MNINQCVYNLIEYAKTNLSLKPFDADYAVNRLYDYLQVPPSEIAIVKADAEYVKKQSVPDNLLMDIKESLSLNVSGQEEDKFFCGIMAICTPMPTQVEDEFWDIHNSSTPQKACDYLYGLSIANYYIKKTAIDKNKFWRVDYEDNYLEITINLSKPEKSNAEIAKLLSAKATGYPSCALCYENLGYNGGDTKSPRQNIRFIPLEINGEEWFYQYSPYAYYDEHCIVISKIHRPMCIDRSTYAKLRDFVRLFPNYFIGSNASLSIVGGSILNHEHFQGGLHKLPVCFAKDKVRFSSKKYSSVDISIVDWYNSCVKLSSKCENDVVALAGDFTEAWGGYSDESCDILAKTNNEEHNSITPVMYYEGENLVVEMILRNNRTTEEYPDGLFHAHREYHNIKKEGIGIIEAMGMFILPGRLLVECDRIAEFLTGAKTDLGELDNSPMAVHKDAISMLVSQYGSALSSEEANRAVKNYINDTCKNILLNTACFKNDKAGISGFNKFMRYCDFEEVE